MSVVGTAEEMPDSPSGQDGENEEFTRKFLVETDDIDDGPITVLAAGGVPFVWQAYGTPNEGNAFCRVRNRRARRVKPGGLWWIATCTYRRTEDEEEEDEQNNPLVEVPEIEMGFETHQVPVWGAGEPSSGKRHGGDGLCSSAGEPFDPPPMRDESRMVLTIGRNEAVDNGIVALAIDYIDAVASDAFFGQAAEQPKMQSIRIIKQQRKDENGDMQDFLRVTYTIHFQETWELELLDQGTYYLDPDDNTRKVKFKAGDTPTIGLLDGNGGALTIPVAPGDAVYLTPVRIYKTRAFAGLNLPQSFAEGKAKAG